MLFKSKISYLKRTKKWLYAPLLKIKYAAYVSYFFIFLVAKKRQDGISLVQTRGFATTIWSGLRWSQKKAKMRIRTTKLDYSHHFSPEDFFPRILFVTPDSASPSHVYRVENHIIALRKIGVTCAWLGLNETDLLEKVTGSIEILYLYRVGITLQEPWFNTAVKNGVRIIYDTDDLTFDRANYIPKFVDGLNFVSEKTRNHLMGEFIDQQLELIKKCDLTVGTTQKIVESFKKLGSESILIPNSVPTYMSEYAVAKAAPKLMDNRRVIGYASGSNTHRKDFAEVTNALLYVLENNPDCIFECIGFLPFNLTTIPKHLIPQIRVLPLVQAENLLATMSNWDVCLAPVELDNPFTESKSSLKYVHAALAGVVTVASPTEPFKNSIKNGETGFLATSHSDWKNYLQVLLENSELRNQMASLAYEDVIQNHTIDANLKHYREMMRLVGSGKHGLFEKLETKPWVALILNDPSLFSGGAKMALNLICAFGSEAKITVTFLNNPSDREVALFFQHYEISNELYKEELNVNEPDLLIATFWKTADYLISKRIDPSKVIYFVQDFEPYFYPVNLEFVQASQTYEYFRDSLVVLGSWNKKMLEQFFGIQPMLFLELPVDMNLYKSRSVKTEFDCLFFTRNNSERRLPDLMRETIQRISLMNPELKIGVFGTFDLGLQFRSNVTVLGEIDSELLPDLYSKSSLGVVASPTNTSRIPFEMVACGLPVIDIKGIFQTDRYPADFPVKYASPTADDVASEILNLLSNPEELSELQLKTYKYRGRLTSEAFFMESIQNFAKSIL